MSLRGINFEHRPGDFVLCFEPDPTKARVLYDAKIIEQSVGRDTKGKRKPAYLVHFMGWNNSWDRIVPESLVLRDSEENRELKKHITKVAKKTRTNSIRKRKIEYILRESLPKKRRVNLYSFDSDSSSNSDSDEKASVVADSESMTESEKHDDSDSQSEEQGDGESSESEEVEEMEEDEEGEEEEEVPPRDVNIEISEGLKRKLEDDCINIQSKKRLIHLPAEPNVIGILEGYVKNFGTNLVYAETKHYPSRGDRDKPPPPDKSIDLCKEVVDGLRIIFDFTLESLLLYDVEREYYKNSVKSFTHSSIANKAVKIKTEAGNVISSPAHSSQTDHAPPKLRRRCKSSSSNPHSPRADCSSPPPAVNSSSAPALTTKHGVHHDINANACTEAPPTRRMTRHNHAVLAAASSSTEHCGQNRAHESKSDTHVHCGQHEPNETKGSGRSDTSSHAHTYSRRRGSLRSRSKWSSDDDEIVFKHEVEERCAEVSSGHKSAEETAKPEVSGLDGSHKSSHHTGNQTSESSLPSLVYQHGYRSKEAALNDIFSWKLVPDDLYSKSPVPPSLICGAHHFLRLFVKLPELLSQMRIPDEHFGPLLNHIQMFVEYMSNSCDELLPDSVYIDC